MKIWILTEGEYDDNHVEHVLVSHSERILYRNIQDFLKEFTDFAANQRQLQKIFFQEKFMKWKKDRRFKRPVLRYEVPKFHEWLIQEKGFIEVEDYEVF